MRWVAIVACCIAAAVAYGILHDQVTARVCVEYFTIGHPTVFPTESPTLLGIGWGIIATWWVGALLGVPLAFAARAGRRPKHRTRLLSRPVAILLLSMAASALVSGMVGYALGRLGVISLVEPLASRVPSDRHDRYLADLWAHSASYAVGVLGGLVVIVHVWRSRGRLNDQGSRS